MGDNTSDSRNDAKTENKDSFLSYLYKKKNRDLPPMPPAAKRNRGEYAPGTDELIGEGYRVPFVDTMRGFAIAALVLYGFIYDIYTFGFFRGTGFAGFISNIYADESLPYWIFGFKCLFIFVSGISANYSRNNYKRALRLLIGAVMITLGSMLFFGPSGAIYFGILHFLAFAALVYAIMHKYCDKVFDKLPLTVFIGLFLVAVFLTDHFIFDKVYISLFGAKMLVPYFITGFVHTGFNATGFFGILPWIFIYFVGVIFGRYMKEGVVAENLYKLGIPGLDDIGRNTLIIYILHQPVIYGLLYILDLLLIK